VAILEVFDSSGDPFFRHAAGQIQIEHILPGLASLGARLYLGEIDVSEGEDTQAAKEQTRFVHPSESE